MPRAGPNLAIASRKPVATALVRQASTSVSNAGHGEEGDVDVMAGARNDLVCIWSRLAERFAHQIENNPRHIQSGRHP